MNTDLKLENETSITDSNFAVEAIAYMDRESIENCNDFLEAFEKLNVADEIYNPLVDECFNIIGNYVGIGTYTKNIRYFETAVEVMTGLLQLSLDYHNTAETAYGADDGSNYGQNYVYARTIILDGLIKTFSIGKDSPQDILNVYQQVVVFKYTQIKKVTINEIEFTDISKAQEYINNQILLKMDAFYQKTIIPFEIIVVLSDEYEAFDLVLNISEAFENNEYWKESLVVVLSEVHEFFGRGLPAVGEAPDTYEINLSGYKKEDIGVVDLRFLHRYIYSDMNRYLVKHEVNEEDITLALVNFAFSTLKESYQYQIQNNETIEDRYLILKFFALDGNSHLVREAYNSIAYYADHHEQKNGIDEMMWRISSIDTVQQAEKDDDIDKTIFDEKYDFAQFESLVTAESFEAALDKLAHKIEEDGRIDEYESRLSTLADTLTELMKNEMILD